MAADQHSGFGSYCHTCHTYSINFLFTGILAIQAVSPLTSQYKSQFICFFCIIGVAGVAIGVLQSNRRCGTGVAQVWQVWHTPLRRSTRDPAHPTGFHRKIKLNQNG